MNNFFFVHFENDEFPYYIQSANTECDEFDSED